MKPGHLKGALLEYLVRRLLTKCGFTAVNADGLYVYEQARDGLFFINGKGAAHDADVLMDPPIQMPFSYPSRILFECKAYNKNVGLDVMRNALGLKYDINEFEIVTDDFIRQRQNNNRTNYAIAPRKRFNYQVGVAVIGDFTPSSIEFAANNKISLLSLKWFMDKNIIELIHKIDETYLSTISISSQHEIYSFLKDRDVGSINRNQSIASFIENDSKIGVIIRSFESVINRCYFGLLETGDLIFLFADQSDSPVLSDNMRFDGLKAQIHYNREEPNIWKLTIIDGNIRDSFKFFVPKRIMDMWKQFNLDKNVAIDLKEEYFSRIFIFSKPMDRGLPFFVVSIDKRWLDDTRLNNNPEHHL